MDFCTCEYSEYAEPRRTYTDPNCPFHGIPEPREADLRDLGIIP